MAVSKKKRKIRIEEEDYKHSTVVDDEDDIWHACEDQWVTALVLSHGPPSLADSFASCGPQTNQRMSSKGGRGRKSEGQG
jgi:hypothetical protein